MVHPLPPTPVPCTPSRFLCVLCALLWQKNSFPDTHTKARPRRQEPRFNRGTGQAQLRPTAAQISSVPPQPIRENSCPFVVKKIQPETASHSPPFADRPIKVHPEYSFFPFVLFVPFVVKMFSRLRPKTAPTHPESIRCPRHHQKEKRLPVMSREAANSSLPARAS